MKSVISLVACLAALASALPSPALQERSGTCHPGVKKVGAYHFDDHCGQIFDLKKSNYKVMSIHKDLGYNQCVFGCSSGPDKCCAVNYDISTRVCYYLQRDDNTDECFKTPVFYSPAPGYDSSTCVPPFHPNDG